MNDTETSKKQDIRSLIDKTLIDFFNASVVDAEKIDKYYGALWHHLLTLHSSGGKRLRPMIVVMAYEAFGGKDVMDIIPVACAQELLHFSMLIHDDIIDRDTTRYGVDNISGRYEKDYQTLAPHHTDQMHYANSAAIIGGDLMIAAAHKMIAESNVSDEKKMIAINTMYESMFNVAGGQLLDTESSFRPMGAIEPLKVAHYKTASYSFEGPLVTGAQLAGATADQQSLLRDFAINLGIAYQLADDLLGVFGDQTKTGKSNSGDIREGKKTYLIEQTIARLSIDDLKIFQSTFGKQSLTDNDIITVKDLIVRSRGKDATEQQINTYVTRATDALKKLSLNDAAHAEFNQLIDKATKRDF